MKTFNDKCEEIIKSYQINEGIFDTVKTGLKDLGRGFLKAVTDPAKDRWNKITGGSSGKQSELIKISNIERIIKNDPSSIKKEGIPFLININNKKFVLNGEAIMGILKNTTFVPIKRDDFLNNVFAIDPKIPINSFATTLKKEILGKDLSALGQESEKLGGAFNKMIPDIQTKLKENVNILNTIDKNNAYKMLYKILLLAIILDLQKLQK